MEETLAKKKPNTLATVAENEPPQDSVVRSAGQEEHDSEVESNSGSVVEKDAASASGSTSSEELLYLDESVPVPAKRPLDAVTASSSSSPFGTGRSAKLPPRVPTTTNTAATLPTPAPDSEVVEGVLPSQPSIVRRMQETNKFDVDPKDARNLLPGVLLNSGSLDLDGVIDGMEARVTEKKRQEQEALLHLLRQKELENLYLAQQQQQQQQELLFAASGLELLTSALNEQCHVSPPGFGPSQFQPPTQQQQPPPSHHHRPQQQVSQDMARHPLLLQQMLGRPRHGRSVSDPTFAFAGALQSMPPSLAPFHHPTPSVDPVTTLPLVDQSDALAFLSRQNLQPQQQQPDWSTPDVTMQPSLGGNALLSIPPNPVPPEMPNVETSPSQRRRRHGPSKSVDFNVLTKQNKNKNNNSSAKERHTPLSPSTGNKTTTRAEVKKMVEYQASLGRPTYAPWFRDRSNRNSTPREGEVPGDKPSAHHHHRTQSLPHVHTSLTTNVPTTTTTAVTPRSPDTAKDLQQPTPKSARVGTGVFFPRMPVPN